jgi:hypothetical protein
VIKLCPDRMELGVPARPANALNVEIGQPLTRCRLKTPEHWGHTDPRGARWLLSGGSPLVLGLCSSNCPRQVPRAPLGRDGASAVAHAVLAGLVVHVEHPDFPLTLTAGRSSRADGSRYFEMIAHGATSHIVGDLEDEFDSAIALGRALSYQVGNRRALWAARAALERLS